MDVVLINFHKSICMSIGGAQLATNQNIVVSLWGRKEPSKDHPLHIDNAAATAIVALHITMMDDTQVTDQISTSWLNYMIKSSTKTSFVDLLSPNGKQ
jgi:hypothetical protein